MERRVTGPPAETREGWQLDKHPLQRVYHYIRGTFSLCGKLGFYLGDLAPDDAAKRSKEDCKACTRKLDKGVRA